ncbi:hypothetical protein F5I97DRAFT_1809615 [Phlebopus sp. FC_14]|nr:hypothetical protein F5I97DRAFT_1809615 [Phlebopus sp. FC_14]
MGHGKRASLKATLQSQQSRLRLKQRAAHAAEVAELKGKRKSHGARKAKAPARQPTVPFKPTDKILLIGEGNFSFTRALLIEPPSALEHLPPANVTATSYDSEEQCYAKYPGAQEIIQVIKGRGAEVIFGVDATKLQKHTVLKGRRWDRIVWNFPHAGKGITDQSRNILSNQRLILEFLRSAPHCLALGSIPDVRPHRQRKKQAHEDEDESSKSDVGDSDAEFKGRGTVLITLRNVAPYTTWNIPQLAKTPPKPSIISELPYARYRLLRSFVFHRGLWKGYEHRMTKGERAHGQGKTGEGGEDRTWEFCLQD